MRILASAGMLVFIWAVLSACKGEEFHEPTPPWPDEFHWLDRRPVEAKTWDTLVDLGGGNSEKRIPAKIHRLLFVAEDSLLVNLWEFPRDYWAYYLFHRNAPFDVQLEAGIYRKGPALIFHIGTFLGEVSYAHHAMVPQAYLVESLKGLALGGVPAVFHAFPRLNRVGGSERVHVGQPLGHAWENPAFSAAYPCLIDTARIFRLPGADAKERLSGMIPNWKGALDTLSWGSELRFVGRTDRGIPVVFHASKVGLVGIEGCTDPKKAREYVEIVKKMDVLLQKP